MLLAVLLSVGCAASQPDTAAVAPRPDPSPTPTGDFGGGDPCPDVADGQGCRSSMIGDLDGDGVEDEVRIYAATLSSGYPKSWVLEAALSSGGIVRAGDRWWPGSTVGEPPKSADWWSGYPDTVAMFDLDGDGKDEAFVKVIEHILHGGSVPDHALFSLRKGRLIPLRGEDGEIFIVPLGGVSYFGHGMRCLDRDGDGRRELVILRVENAATATPDWSRRYYDLRGTTLVQTGRREGTMTRDGFPDPDVDAFYRLRCDDTRVVLW